MSKHDLAMESIAWKIEAEENTIEEMRQSIKNAIDSKNIELDAAFILSYAQRMDEAVKKLATLRETKRMLESLAV
ncbi:MAG: hypothetical protein ACI4WX_06265 [Aristaeellaceae bacterium]